MSTLALLAVRLPPRYLEKKAARQRALEQLRSEVDIYDLKPGMKVYMDGKLLGEIEDVSTSGASKRERKMARSEEHRRGMA